MNANDLLTDKELSDITGVKPGARSRTEKVMTTLRQAGIYCWLRYDGTVATTWTHVHNAGLVRPEGGTTAKKPNFAAVNKVA